MLFTVSLMLFTAKKYMFLSTDGAWKVYRRFEIPIFFYTFAVL
jgi:hypothetical protein